MGLVNNGLHCKMIGLAGFLRNPCVNAFTSFLLDRSDSSEKDFPKFFSGIGGLCLVISLVGVESTGKKAGGDVWEGKGISKHSVCKHSAPWDGLPRHCFLWSLAPLSGKVLLIHYLP